MISGIDRIAIPIHNVKGELVAYAGRFPGEAGEDTPKYKLPAGFRKSQELFNIDRAVKQPADMSLVIVEGFFDAMKLHQHGCYNVVALTAIQVAVPCDADPKPIRTFTTFTDDLHALRDCAEPPGGSGVVLRSKQLVAERFSSSSWLIPDYLISPLTMNPGSCLEFHLSV